MTELPRLLSIRTSLAGRWQIPLLMCGGLLFAGVLADAVWKHKPVTFEQQLTYIQRLRDAKAYERTSAYVMDQMKTQGRPASERGELARLLARVVYDVESCLMDHRKENVRAILSNYRLAQRYGAELKAVDWTAFGDAYDWSRDEVRAAEAYREALRMTAVAPDRLRRRLVEIQLVTPKSAGALSSDSVTLIDQMLASESASPVNYAWALELDIERLLDAGDVTTALVRVDQARKRLAGTEELLGVTYLEALCRRQAGTFAEAEAILRSLRDEWKPRDELWAKAGWLLGRVQQEVGRPEAALAVHDEVLKTFRNGKVYSQCRLGRAECLAALNRYEEAYDLFVELLEPGETEHKDRVIDPVALRTSIGAIGDSLLSRNSPDLGIKYLELALKHTDESDRTTRTFLTTRLASALMQKAREAPDSSPDEVTRKQALRARSAEMHLSLYALLESDEENAVHAFERAVAELDAAGMRDRLIEVLDRYASTKVAGQWRSTALYELGRACQAAHRYTDAISAYQDLIQTYPRMPDALRSMVPLAECLLVVGSEAKDGAAVLRQKGVALLESIVKDRGKQQVFAPTASEYREALYQLAEFHSRMATGEMSDHVETAVAYWEDWLALFPEDARRTHAEFMLGDGYRRSAQLVGKSADAQTVESLQKSHRDEAARRFNQAQVHYERVIDELAAVDASRLSPRDDRYLRASYLYRADCLFDLGRYAEAQSAYSETAWRYENLPTAVMASVQAAHCQQRLGKSVEAGAALSRARWLLAKIPAGAFEAEFGQPTKVEWQSMVERIEKAGLF
ncbi:MAG: tetratricopeptide repeat protein [Planctomycetota bacterium]